MDANLHTTQLELFHAIFDKSCDAVVVVDQLGKVRFWSHSAESLFGFPRAEMLGTDLIANVVPHRDREVAREMFTQYQATGQSEFLGKVLELVALHADQRNFWIDLSLTDVQVDGQRWLLGIIRDAESRKGREANLLRQARTDSLSGLPNRSEFQIRLEAQDASKISVAIVDVDQFKRINDSHGHPIGDEAILHVANNLREHFADAICTARLGGDEFGVVIQSTDRSALQTRFDKFLAELAQAEYSERQLNLTISVGVAVASRRSTSRTLLTTADKAMYASKQAGRNQVTVVQDP